MSSLRKALRSLRFRHFNRLFRTLFHGGSYGLNGIDKRLVQIIQPVRQGGYYVELGANDGLRQSNTYLLQHHFGWCGLLIEPSPLRFLECVQNRSFGSIPAFRCAACVDSAYTDTFVEMEYSDLMSVAHGLDLSRVEVLQQADRGLPFLVDAAQRHRFGAEARTLTSLLDEVGAPANFDLLSLDVEGNELAVLRGLDLNLYRPRWILAECRHNAVPIHLEAAGYRHMEVLTDSGTYRDILFCAA
ncbi:MAG: FkbM family methyltransferase [Synechococcaceae cyanobacterium ELA445]